jgi:hypothetical protein
LDFASEPWMDPVRGGGYGRLEKQIPLIGPEGTHAARHALRERSSMMDNRDYPCSAMPDALCCWVFHLPPNAGLCVRYVWDSRHCDGTF